MRMTSSDQQLVQEVKQAIKDDQSLAVVANDIQVTVKDGAITLDGEVASNQQMNLANNTATAVGVVDEIENHLEIVSPVKNKIVQLKALSRADDDGFAIRI